MALQEVTAAFIKRIRLSEQPLNVAWKQQCLQRRWASDSAKPSSIPADIEDSSFLKSGDPDAATIANFDPVANAKKRGHELPPSRYNFRPAKYNRGPLHPHQPPPPTDPSSREFIPGPFSLPRLTQTYESTIAPDLMTLAYTHWPPGFQPPVKGPRLRSWTGDSPYFKGRPLRGPRGRPQLSLLRQRMTFRNIPRIERITVHTYSKDAINNSSYLHAAGMILQAITNVRATAHKTRKANAMFKVKANSTLSVTCDMYGEDMYHFLSKVVDVVLPRIKDWKGVKGSTGDSSGNLAFGLTPEQVALFPEVEINYDSYPEKHIPGLHIIVHTTATQDREARLLLGAMGIPFYGKLVN